MDKLMTVGEVAGRMGVTVRTLQYYDREDILKPTAFSEGGRRLYTHQDLIRLHQILSFKHLGFSLEAIKKRILPMDTPDQIAGVLSDQHKAVQEQITELQEVAKSIAALEKEVRQTKKVDFQKYAAIIESLRMDSRAYWVWKCLDEDLTTQVQENFSHNHELGNKLLRTYYSVLDETLLLKRRGEKAASEKSLALAARWWRMILDFTGGDMTLLPKLLAFSENTAGWEPETGAKQEEIGDFLEQILDCYFEKNPQEET